MNDIASRSKSSPHVSHIKQLLNEATLHDIQILIKEKMCTGKLSFQFSILSKFLIGLATIFSGIQLHIPNAYFSIITLVCNVVGMTCLGFSHFFATESADKTAKLIAAAKQLHIDDAVVIDVADAVENIDG